MHRMLFEKTGRAVWMSHLDTMRLMQRAFRRAGVLLHHSQGYTPHAYVSVLLPLSVGTESVCEILEYELDEPLEITPGQMNAVLPEGVRVREFYESGRKAKELTDLLVELTLEYDGVTPPTEAVAAVLGRESLPVEKRTKRGMEETDIKPLLHDFAVTSQPGRLTLQMTVSAQNPALNPMLVVSALKRYAPECRPDFASCRRLEVLDATGEVFR